MFQFTAFSCRGILYIITCLDGEVAVCMHLDRYIYFSDLSLGISRGSPLLQG